MNVSTKVLSDVILHTKYAKYLPDKMRRETWEEVVDRNMNMHIKKFPHLEKEIRENYKFVYDRKVLPSMRSLQFAGRPIELNNARLFNCSALAMDSVDSFSETMFLLLSGCGVGFSVQKQHISKLPPVRGPIRAEEDNGHKKRYLVGDHIEGWSDAIKVLVESYFFGKKEIEFDFRDIRPKGALLVTSGGKAPGPQPLKDCIHNIVKVFESALAERGRNCRLTSLEVHDLMCYIADAVLAGGIRRSAMISFFNIDDEDMLTCKSGNWWESNPQRARANNSVYLLRSRAKKEDFNKIWEIIKANKSGEPGIFFSNDLNYMGNPCQPAWAKVLTPEGIKKFEDIDVGSLIWSKDGWTKVVKKWCTGVKKVYKYSTTAGVFYGTENHRVVSGGIKVEAKDASSIEILSGPFSDQITIDPQDVMDGLVIGDGSVHKASNNLVYLLVGEKDQDYFDSEIADLLTKERSGLAKGAYEITTTIQASELPKTYDRKVPGRFMTNRNKMAGFLRGLFSANGSVVGNRITLKASSKQIIEDAQTMLSALGIQSYYTTNHPSMVKFSNGEYLCKQSYDLNITIDREKFVKIIGFIHGYKNDTVKIVNGNKLKNDYDIVSVDLVSEEAVYDITVDNDSHTYWTQGCNVSNCLEASIKPFQFCNLTTMNVSTVESQEDFNARCRASSFLATLQATYTDFHYLRDEWRVNTEKDALLGISMTGIASQWFLDNVNIEEGAKEVLNENEKMAKILKINKASRTCLVKPDGTSSLLLGSSSGIHPWYAPYYIRRVRVGKDESIYTYFVINNPDMLEEDMMTKNTAIIKFPIKAPDGAITRNESAMDILKRIKRINDEWIIPGHRKGSNTHNTSVTVNIKDDEWDTVGDWMWNNRESYNGIAVLPYDNGTYVQAPFEEITKEQYEEMVPLVHEIDLSGVFEKQDNTNHQGEVACGGGGCSVV